MAAGINMPARTTVITKTKKRTFNGVVSLRTSEVLQMAGRAGRRGMDAVGHVVFVRNESTNAHHAHKILTSRIDSIESHFQASYGMIIKLMSTRTLEECRILIEKGLGTFLLETRQRIKQNRKVEKLAGKLSNQPLPEDTEEAIEQARKLVKRLGDSPCRHLQNLIEQLEDALRELSALQGLFGAGSAVELPDGTRCLHLGTMERRDLLYEIDDAIQAKPLHVLVSASGEIVVVEYCADRALEPVVIAEGVASVDNASAWLLRALQEMREPLDVVASANSEDIVREQLGDAVEVVFRAQWDAWDDQGLGEVLSQLPSLSPRTERGLLAPQLKVVANLEGRLAKDPLYVGGLTDSVLSALDLLARNPTLDEHEEEQKKLYNEEKNKAWRKFRGGLKVLEHYKALEGAHPSELGHRVSSFAWDNDLWAGIVFGKTKQLAELNDAELAGVALLMNVDGDRAKREKFFGGPCTPALQRACGMLKDTLADLQNVEDKYHEVNPHNLHVPVAPLGVHWAKGVSWRELCAMTTLDQGDLSRWLRRAVDLLRQVANAEHVDRVIAAKAVAAANLLDRYPIADVLPEEGKDLMSPYGHDSVSTRDEAEYATSSESGGSEDADEQGRYEKDEDVLLAELQGKVASILNQYNDESRTTSITGRQDRKNGFERAHSGGSKDPAWLRHRKHKDKKKAHRGEEKKEKEVLKMKDEEEL